MSLLLSYKTEHPQYHKIANGIFMKATSLFFSLDVGSATPRGTKELIMVLLDLKRCFLPCFSNPLVWFFIDSVTWRSTLFQYLLFNVSLRG